MKRSWTIGAGLILGVMTGAAWAGPPQPMVPSRTSEVLRQDDLAPQARLVKRPAAVPAETPPPEAPGPVLAPERGVVPASFVVNQLPDVAPRPTAPLPEPIIVPQAPVFVPQPTVAEASAWQAACNYGEPPLPLVYGSAEYLLWWIRDSHYPVLASTGPFQLTPGAESPFAGSAGVLGQPGTVVLFGGDGVDNEERSGGRFTIGGWLPKSKVGLEVTGFFLGERSVRFRDTSGDHVIARPFFNLATLREDVQTAALPGISTGSLSIDAPSQLWGIDGNLQCMLCSSCFHQLRLLGGFRYLNLKEGLFIREDIALGPNVSTIFNNPDLAFLNNANAQVFDSFDCRNQFYGGQLGLAGRLLLGTWTVDVFGKVALGGTRQRVIIDGGQVIDSPLLGRQTFTGGLLALSSNIGDRDRCVFSVVPEAGVTLGKQLGPLRLFAGYNFLFWSNVVRPGDQIDRNLNPFLIPNFPVDPRTVVNPNPGQRPTFTFNDTGFWAQGLTFGMELSF